MKNQLLEQRAFFVVCGKQTNLSHPKGPKCLVHFSRHHLMINGDFFVEKVSKSITMIKECPSAMTNP